MQNTPQLRHPLLRMIRLVGGIGLIGLFLGGSILRISAAAGWDGWILDGLRGILLLHMGITTVWVVWGCVQWRMSGRTTPDTAHHDEEG